ncbi:hypothetical protein [Micromonospora sonneratiae]|uniref:YbaB/EbfC DNA-binding family protein n=1 Tax=Micromonospora sonneratiae TaxID=1184706 RepID=A0ABW3YK79_9ACTN
MSTVERPIPTGPVERLTRLRTEALGLSRLIHGATDSDGQYRGRDESGLVSLTVQGNGRVDSVGIDEGWFSRRGASGIGPALFEAYRSAMTEAMTGVAERITAAEEDASLLSVDEPVVTTPPAETFRRVTFDDVEEALRAHDQLRDELRERRRTPPESERRLSGPHQLVTIVVRDGNIAEITVAGHVVRSQARLLSQDAMAAFSKLGA